MEERPIDDLERGERNKTFFTEKPSCNFLAVVSYEQHVEVMNTTAGLVTLKGRMAEINAQGSLGFHFETLSGMLNCIQKHASIGTEFENIASCFKSLYVATFISRHWGLERIKPC